jgi:hypothetical protein
MEKDLGDTIDRWRAVRETASVLNASLDQGNEVVKRLNELLTAELDLQVTAETEPFEVTVCGGTRPGPRTCRLVYGNHDGYYHVFLLQREGSDGEEWADEWSVCPKEVRVSAIPKVPELLGALVENSARLLTECRAATERVRKIIAGLA